MKVEEYGKINMVGEVCGRLVVIKDSGKRIGGRVIWECQCECGNICEVEGNKLRSKHTLSCGCLMKERFAKAGEPHRYTAENHSGPKHWNWKGGIGPRNERLTKTYSYLQWKKYILIRDNYTCEMCGYNKCLEVHHIKCRKDYPKLIIDKSNGITLCAFCHKLITRSDRNAKTSKGVNVR